MKMQNNNPLKWTGQGSIQERKTTAAPDEFLVHPSKHIPL